LRTLGEVARTGHFSAAAETLHLTQPAVSNQIRVLEQELGVALLERIGKRARPTPEGQVLITALSRAATELETALDTIACMQAKISGTLVLAAGATATNHLLPAVIVNLRASHPGIDLRLRTGDTETLLPGILDGSIDLGLVTAPVDEARLQQAFFFRDRLACITPRDAALGAERISPRDLIGRQLILYDRAGAIRRAVDSWLDAIGRERVRVTDIGSAEGQIAFVRAGLGWSIVSEIAARAAADAGEINLVGLEPPLFRDLALVWRADRASRPIIAAALRVFLEYAERTFGPWGR